MYGALIHGIRRLLCYLEASSSDIVTVKAVIHRMPQVACSRYQKERRSMSHMAYSWVTVTFHILYLHTRR